MIERISERIEYLKQQELKALKDIDTMPAPSIERKLHWLLINELAARRNELEQLLKP